MTRMSPVESSEIRIRNDLAELDRLETVVLDFCREHGVDDEASHDVLLVLDESVSNTIRHGYTDRRPHEITVRMRMHGTELSLEIEDDARPFDPLAAPAPDLSRALEDRPLGGLGIHLMRQLMHSMDYRRQGERNVLRLTRLVQR